MTEPSPLKEIVISYERKGEEELTKFADKIRLHRARDRFVIVCDKLEKHTIRALVLWLPGIDLFGPQDGEFKEARFLSVVILLLRTIFEVVVGI